MCFLGLEFLRGFLSWDFWVLMPWFLIPAFGLRFDFLVYLFGLDCLVWIPGFEFLRFDSFVWISGFGFLGLDPLVWISGF